MAKLDFVADFCRLFGDGGESINNKLLKEQAHSGKFSLFAKFAYSQFIIVYRRIDCEISSFTWNVLEVYARYTIK